MQASITLDVKHGPALSACVDVINLVVAVAELVPDHHMDDRAELLARAQDLRLLVERNLTVKT